ncbi:MAG: type IV pilin protein [Nevskiales bacterium]
MKRQSGFTLIELMIAVAIVGILASIAYPSYLGSVRKSNRGSAQAFMMEIAQREQAMFLDRRSYVAVANNAAFPGALNISPPAEVSARYNLSVALTASPPGFTISAVAQGNQDGPKDGDEDLVLQSDGTKTRDGDPAKW